MKKKPEVEQTPDTCETCVHWKNKQRLLNYWKNTGFCTNVKFKFNTVTGRLVGVIDTENLVDQKKVPGNPSHDIETIMTASTSFSRYILTTEEDFGCIYHEKRTAYNSI
jgi:hypothetical protein